MVRAPLVLRHAPSEFTPGEDHHALLGVAVGSLDAREIVVEGADRSAQRAHQVRVIDGLVAVRVPASQAREEHLGGQSRGQHLRDQFELVGE